jgi:hypothetical protein
MKIPALALLPALLSCESVPPGPPLPSPVRFEQRISDEAFERSVEITVDESGRLKEFMKRSLLRDVRRHGQLSAEQMRELASLLDRFAHAAALPAPAGVAWGVLQFGEKRAAWGKDAVLPAELAELAKWLRTTGDDFPMDRDH